MIETLCLITVINSFLIIKLIYVTNKNVDELETTIDALELVVSKLEDK